MPDMPGDTFISKGIEYVLDYSPRGNLRPFSVTSSAAQRWLAGLELEGVDGFLRDKLMGRFSQRSKDYVNVFPGQTTSSGLLNKTDRRNWPCSDQLSEIRTSSSYHGGPTMRGSSTGSCENLV